jgi:putative restriction endonuclease
VATTLTYTEAFRAFGAKLVNPMWAYSALADDGAIVLSCWSHKLKLRDGVLRYEDRLSRWEPNTPGKNLLIQHLTKARDEALPVRLVVATTDQPDVVDRGEPADKIKKTFHIKPEVEGRVVLFDGDNFRLEFRRQ